MKFKKKIKHQEKKKMKQQERDIFFSMMKQREQPLKTLMSLIPEGMY